MAVACFEGVLDYGGTYACGCLVDAVAEDGDLVAGGHPVFAFEGEWFGHCGVGWWTLGRGGGSSEMLLQESCAANGLHELRVPYGLTEMF